MIYQETLELQIGGVPTTGPTFRGAVVPVTVDQTALQWNVTGDLIVTVAYRLLCSPLPAPHEINERDWILWRGGRYAVIGIPMMHTARGRVHHVEAFLGTEAVGN